MRLNLRNEKRKRNFAILCKFSLSLVLLISVTSQKHSKPKMSRKPRERELLQFTSPLMNTFSNYMKRANVESQETDTPLKKEVAQMTQTIQNAKEKGMKHYLNKQSKKKSLKKRKKVSNPFLDDIKKFMGGDSPAQATGPSPASPAKAITAPVATNEDKLLVSQTQEDGNRELEMDAQDRQLNRREVQSASQSGESVSVASDPSELDNLEQVRSEKNKLDQEERSIENQESQLKREEAELEKEKMTIGKAEQELKMEEQQFNTAKAQEYQKINQFEQDIGTKEQYLSTENTQMEHEKQEVHQKLQELTAKIHQVEAKQHEFEEKLKGLDAQKEQIARERGELNSEQKSILESKRISEGELKTAKEEQINIDHENEDLQNRVQEVKAMRNQLHDLKDAYSVAFHKVVVHENNLKTREKMLQVAESEVSRQKADLAQKLIQFKNEYALLISREQAVSVRMGDVVQREDFLSAKKEKRKLTQGKEQMVTDELDKQNQELKIEQQSFPDVAQPSLTQNRAFLKQLPSELNSLNKSAAPQVPGIPKMGNMLKSPIPGPMAGFPPMSAYNNMPMPNFQNYASPTRKIFGGDSVGNNKMIFQPSKGLVNMMDRPKFLDDPYMKTKNFFKDEKLLI